MSISQVLATGLASMQSSINRLGATSGKIAAFGTQDEQIAANLVALRQDEIGTKLAADVIKVGDQVLGTIIDLRE